MLKVDRLDHEETRCEGDPLALWDGDGAVRLLDVDPCRGALLSNDSSQGPPWVTMPTAMERNLHGAGA